MPYTKRKPEEIVAKLKQVDSLVSKDQAVRKVAVTQFAYYRWHK